MRRSGLLLAAALAGLALGGSARVAGAGRAADTVWAVITVAALIPAVVSVVADLWRRRLGVDIVAVLALAGCLAVGEFLAGAVIAVMLASGRVLEHRAAARAERELHHLLARTPREAHRYEGEVLTSPPLSAA